jgi:DNA-directed RNA polymerase specialized sigma24 family protein
MKRAEFFQIVQPLTEKLYRLAYSLVPDDLQSEQLIIDSLNAYLIKEKKAILWREVNLEDKKELQLIRRTFFKGILKYLSDIGTRRSLQLLEQMKLSLPQEFKSFYSLDPKVRLVVTMRYDFQFTVEEIVDVIGIPRYEVIEKLHNGRFLLLNNVNQGVTV